MDIHCDPELSTREQTHRKTWTDPTLVEYDVDEVTSIAPAPIVDGITIS